MVRNEIPQGGGRNNLGYLVFAEKGNGEAEYMHDAGGNGQVNNTDEPVLNGCGTSSQPTWLKVEKYGKKFIVSCSRNGTEWTQVGTTTIPSAAATQDIGLFVTSHVQGTKATAKFTDWTLDTDPDVPEDPSTPAPTCPPAATSDEFDGPLSTHPLDHGPRPGGAAARDLGRRAEPRRHQRRHRRHQHGADLLRGPGDCRRATGRRRPRSRSITTTPGSTPASPSTSTTTTTRSSPSPATPTGGRFVEFWSETNGARTAHGGNAFVADRLTRPRSTCG